MTPLEAATFCKSVGGYITAFEDDGQFESYKQYIQGKRQELLVNDNNYIFSGIKNVFLGLMTDIEGVCILMLGIQVL